MDIAERKGFLEKEKNAYKEILSYIPLLKEVAILFDGKVVNRNFIEKIKEKTEKNFSQEFTTYAVLLNVYSSELQDIYYFRFNINDFDKTESGKYRVNAKKFCLRLNEVENSLKETISKYDNADIDGMREEFSQIVEKFNEFKKKYNDSGRVLEIAGCDFELRSCSNLSDYDLVW